MLPNAKLDLALGADLRDVRAECISPLTPVFCLREYVLRRNRCYLVHTFDHDASCSHRVVLTKSGTLLRWERVHAGVLGRLDSGLGISTFLAWPPSLVLILPYADAYNMIFPQAFPSVCTLIHNIDHDAFVVVKQFRPAVWASRVRDERRTAAAFLARIPSDSDTSGTSGSASGGEDDGHNTGTDFARSGTEPIGSGHKDGGNQGIGGQLSVASDCDWSILATAAPAEAPAEPKSGQPPGEQTASAAPADVTPDKKDTVRRGWCYELCGGLINKGSRVSDQQVCARYGGFLFRLLPRARIANAILHVPAAAASPHAYPSDVEVVHCPCPHLPHCRWLPWKSRRKQGTACTRRHWCACSRSGNQSASRAPSAPSTTSSEWESR